LTLISITATNKVEKLPTHLFVTGLKVELNQQNVASMSSLFYDLNQ